MTSNEVTTLKKGLLVLELIKQHNGISLKEIMETQHLSKATAFRMVSTLEGMGYIYKLKTEYFIHHKMFSNGFEKRSKMDWSAMPSIYKIAKNIQMSVYVGKMDGTDLVMSQVLHEPFKSSADEEIGNRSKLHLTALGKVILANLAHEDVETVLKKLSLERATENTFQDAQLFRYHLKVIHDDGYAFDNEERNVGVRCVAVPIFRNGQVIAALAVAAPAHQIHKGNMKKIISKLNEGSSMITKEIEALMN